MINQNRPKPIIKWAGGKERELEQITSNLPTVFDNYYEPFVGGGSVFVSIDSTKKFINDLSSELVSLYENISTQNTLFFQYIEQANLLWKNISVFVERHNYLISTYKDYRNEKLSEKKLTIYIQDFCRINQEEILNILGDQYCIFPDILIKEILRGINGKFKRMKKIELLKWVMPDTDVYDNIETAFRSAYYMYFRYLYNSTKYIESPELSCALFYIIRNLCYSGMFRYNSSGEFNVPYGGIAYNSKNFGNQIEYYKSEQIKRIFSNTEIYNLDFETFLKSTLPTKNDFVFLDPPYDSEFSTYAKNEFTQNDHIRLANFMQKECKAKWMLVIKDTELIRSLYNNNDLDIKIFDKEYAVSFMNRNNRKAQHLLIRNYK